MTTTTVNDPHFTPPVEDGMEEPRPDGGGGIGEPEKETASGEDAPERNSPENAKFLQYARDSYESSTTWFDSSMRTTFEKALAHFRSVHAPGSKYHTDAYQKRSRIFRPKTRSAIRRGEAGTAIAFFSTMDVVNCSPINPSDERQRLAAEVHNALLNNRLNRPDMHWFKTIIGGAQDAMSVGVVISKQFWRYEEREQEYEYTFEEEDGTTTIEQGAEKEVIKDQPDVQIVPCENFRFDPAADWRDPVNSSPYVIELQPTYIFEINDRIKSGRYWPLRTDMMAAAVHQDWDSIRKMREGERVDRYDAASHVNEYRSVWVHHNIVRINGRDYVYDTIGTEILLEPPRPIEEFYAHTLLIRRRPFEMGMAIIEAHKQYPIGVSGLIEDLQEEANDIANLRLDNVKHAINKRWFIRRGRSVDIRALVRNVPGSGVLMTDPETDVKEIQTRDVTASSYQEQTRIDLDIDDIVGNFSQSSVQANRHLNQTVGGMSMLQGDASMMQEYMIRTITETWVEPVMRQLVALEAIYENDEQVLSVVSGSLKRDLSTIYDVLMEPVMVRCNVGFNATNPQKRIEKLALALATLSNFAPQVAQQVDPAELAKEIFGAVGFGDGTRFLPSLGKGAQEDPRVAALEQQVAQLTQLVEGKQLEIEGRKEVAMINSQTALAKAKIAADVEVMKLEAQGSKEQLFKLLENRLEEYDRMLETEKTAIERQRLWLEREALSHQIAMENAQLGIQQREQTNEERKTAQEAEQKGGGKKKDVDSGSPGAFDLPGNDSAGVISRDRYGLMPGSSM